MRLLFNLLAFLFFINAKADNLLPKKINIQQGLTSNTVNKIYTDKSKLTWIGTSTGTFIYKNGTVFPFLYNNTNVIQNCTDILESEPYELWFATHGLGVFNFKKNKLFNLTIKEGLVNNKVNSLYSTKDFVYIGTNDGLSLYNKLTNEIVNPNFIHFKKYKEFKILKFLELNNQVYFITQNDGTFKIINEKSNPRIIKIRNHDYANSIYLWKNNVYLAEKNRVCIFSVFDYINNINTTKNILLLDNISDFAEDDNQLVAVSQKLYFNKGGIYIIQRDGTFKEYSTYQNLLTQSFNSVFIDRMQEVAFVGTENDGFLIFDLDKSKRFFSTNNLVVQDIQAFQNKILIVTDEDIQLRSAYGELKHVITNKDVLNLLKSNLNFQKKIQFLKAEIYNNQIFIKSNVGFLKLNENLTNVELLSTQDQPLLLVKGVPYKFESFFENKSESDFIGKLYSEQPNKLPHLILQALSFNNDIIVSTKNYGLYIIKNDSSYPLSKISDFKIDQVKHIKKSVNNTLLVVTHFNELYELNPSNNYKIIKKFNDIRLKGQNIYFIDSYKEFHVIGTEIGVEFLSNEKHLILGKDYGLYLPDNITTSIIGNILYVGGNGGIYEFDIDKFLNYKNKVTSIKVTSIQTVENGVLKEINIDDIKNNTLKVNKTQSPLFIKILPQSDTDTESLSIRYKINKESGWSNFTNNNTLQILSFLTNSYSIEVEVLDTISQQTYKFTVLNVKVIDSTLYFKFIAGFLLLIFISYFIYVKIILKRDNSKGEIIEKENKIKNNEYNNNKFLENLDDEICIEQQLMLNSINSHFIFNILNYLNYLILETKTKEALKYSGQFSNFIRCLLKTGAVKFNTLESELEFLKAYIELEKYRYNFNIEFIIELDENIDVTELSLPSFILHPILETIINYSFNTDQNNERIVLEIFEVSSEEIEVKYSYTGKSLNDIDLSDGSRFNKGILLIKTYHQKYKNCVGEVKFNKVDDENWISFKINA